MMSASSATPPRVTVIMQVGITWSVVMPSGSAPAGVVVATRWARITAWVGVSAGGVPARTAGLVGGTASTSGAGLLMIGWAVPTSARRLRGPIVVSGRLLRSDA